jgi:molybdopterin-guanine dinucleotide biosynthesis protein A
MGTDKAWLAWRGRPLLLEVIDRLGMLAPDSIWVVARQGQALPPGPYRRVEDVVADAGPLAGLSAGLAAIAATAPDTRVAVSACDYPFADPRLFHALAKLEPLAELVLPRWDKHLHPLQALWSAYLAESCRAALAAGERRVRSVVDTVAAAIVDARALPGTIDPDRALLNLNDEKSLARARRLAEAPG